MDYISDAPGLGGGAGLAELFLDTPGLFLDTFALFLFTAGLLTAELLLLFTAILLGFFATDGFADSVRLNGSGDEFWSNKDFIAETFLRCPSAEGFNDGVVGEAGEMGEGDKSDIGEANGGGGLFNPAVVAFGGRGGGGGVSFT